MLDSFWFWNGLSFGKNIQIIVYLNRDRHGAQLDNKIYAT